MNYTVTNGNTIFDEKPVVDTYSVSDVIKRQSIGGMVGGTIYGLVWGELSNMLNVVLGLNIGSSPDFGDRMYGYMFRLMAINEFERKTTLSLNGYGAYSGGNPDGMPIESYIPLYAELTNDYQQFVRNAPSDELRGVDTTSKNIHGNKDGRIATENLFPDDLGVGTFNNKWFVSNRNSILYKTKKLFNERKINSLVSRFGTNADGLGDVDYNGKVGYDGIGSSRGRNLKRAPGTGEGSYAPNGYNNPYCRVWTHHHQYDNYEKAIRPFVSESVKEMYPSDGMGPPSIESSTESRLDTMKRLHTWKNKSFDFKEGALSEGFDGEWGWKNNNPEWSHSVLTQQDGVVNIAPKYDENTTIHTKDCMFSIENLAWKGYDPYAFENALSWEQRGPLGGRIMWFPPYGLSFNEQTSVQWNHSTFIGRGEDVYTYSNTTRGGTLSFMMLTDHPSIVDYASWSSENAEKMDDDIWDRFFAGCDSLDGNDEYSLMHYVTPTPMDYIFETREAPSEEPKTEDVNPPVAPKEETPSDSVEEVTFFTFFPNYYTGRESTLFNAETTGTCDFSIAYLLGGLNAQKGEYSQFDEQISFAFSDSSAFKRGYEMSENQNEGITDITTQGKLNNCIKGNKFNWRYMSLDQLRGKHYEEDNNKKWYYRIDGKYEIPQTEREKITNQYAHVLENQSGYQDTTSYGLNLTIDSLDNDLCSNKENVYSFAEVACALGQYMPNCEGVVSYLKTKINSDRTDLVDNLVSLLDKPVESIDIIGYANSQGHTDENELLAKNRAQTILSWLLWYNGDNSISEKTNITSQVVSIGSRDENSKEAKKWRSVKCTIKFKTETTAPSTKENGGFDSVSDNTIQNIETEQEITHDEAQLLVESNGLADTQTTEQNIQNERKTELESTTGRTSGFNKIRYDNEMYFYKKFKMSNPFKWQKLTDKLQYFDPAFHSMTPEGFNMRLTFLQQCTRQGDTLSASDRDAKTASNMAFGRPPFCVLRLGDFYNQLIVIKSINVNYDDDGALTWDLNDEGIGAQPMIAKVTIQFDFIGGSDLAGPVRRLQNAMSFNYYANASLYDNRADRMYYPAEEHLSTKMGGAGNDKPSLPEVKDGKIVSKKGTYSVYNSVQKFKTDEEILEEQKNK